MIIAGDDPASNGGHRPHDNDDGGRTSMSASCNNPAGCIGSPQRQNETIGPGSESWWPLSRFWRTGRVLLGVGGSANPFNGFGYGAGLEQVENMPWGGSVYMNGWFFYHGESVTRGASASVVVYTGGVFNYGPDNPTYASPGTAYQGTACLMGVCVSVTNTVSDTNGHGNKPFESGVSQSITIGVGPGIGLSGSFMRVNPIRILGKDLP